MDSWWEKLDWIEVSMTKALKIWSNNHSCVKCVVGNHNYYYAGNREMKINHSQILSGKWYIEKM